jgi:hypothetical protein
MDTIQPKVTGRCAAAGEPNRAKNNESNKSDDESDERRPNCAERRALASNKKHSYGQHPKPKRYLKKKSVAKRYDCCEKTVDRRVERGVIRPPDIYQGPFGLWDEDKLNEDDEAAARQALADRGTEATP